MGVCEVGGVLRLLEARESLRCVLASAVSFLACPEGHLLTQSCMPSGADHGSSSPTCMWALRPLSGGSAPPSHGQCLSFVSVWPSPLPRGPPPCLYIISASDPCPELRAQGSVLKALSSGGASLFSVAPQRAGLLLGGSSLNSVTCSRFQGAADYFHAFFPSVQVCPFLKNYLF